MPGKPVGARGRGRGRGLHPHRRRQQAFMRHGGRSPSEWRDAGARGASFPLARSWFFDGGFRSASLRKSSGPCVALSHAPLIAAGCNNLLFYSGFRVLSLFPTEHNDRPMRYSRVCTTLVIFEACRRLSAGFSGIFLLFSWGFLPERMRIIFTRSAIMRLPEPPARTVRGDGGRKAGGVPARAGPCHLPGRLGQGPSWQIA